MTDAPDLAGFREAQERKRRLFGEMVVFLFPVDAEWPEGTVFNPEDGTPMDPTVEPVASGQGSASVNCTIAFRSGRDGEAAAAEDVAFGWVPHAHLLLIADQAASAVASGAQDVIARDARWKVVAQRCDGISGFDRFLTYARQR